MEDEHDLERKAVEELLKEASRARIRAETMGPAGWMKCPLGSTNKRFLLNTLRTTALNRRAGNREPSKGRKSEEDSDPVRSRGAASFGPRGHDHSSHRNRGHSRSPVRGHDHYSHLSRGHSRSPVRGHDHTPPHKRSETSRQLPREMDRTRPLQTDRWEETRK